MLRKKIEDLLLSVTKPARYIGGESGSVIKNKDNISVRFAFCFPDTYDIGMSHLGMKILYSLINQRSDYWCERVFAPGIDFEKLDRPVTLRVNGRDGTFQQILQMDDQVEIRCDE